MEINESKNITRIMIRINLLIKVLDPAVEDIYYFFIRSNKIWADINFISARLLQLNDIQLPVHYNNQQWIMEEHYQNQIYGIIQEHSHNFSLERCQEIVGRELDKNFGIRAFQGELLKDYIDYILESKNVNQITYYRHYFYVLTELSDLVRLVALKNMELIPKRLLVQLNEKQCALHEGYKESYLLSHFIRFRFWEKDHLPPMYFKVAEDKKRIAVLFSDIKNFGQTIKQFVDNESLFTQQFVKAYQYQCSLFIKAAGGLVIQTAGDAFMAIFPIQDNEINDLLKVVQAALQMLSISHLHLNGKTIPTITRIGINIAEVQEGYIGPLDLREYTVLGKGVNIASRLEKEVNSLDKEDARFSGGILINLSSCKMDLSEEEERQIEQTINILNNISEISKFPLMAEYLLETAKPLKNQLAVKKIYQSIKERILPLLMELNQQDERYFYHLQEEIKEIKVKEGETRCIALVKMKNQIPNHH